MITNLRQSTKNSKAIVNNKNEHMNMYFQRKNQKKKSWPHGGN